MGGLATITCGPKSFVQYKTCTHLADVYLRTVRFVFCPLAGVSLSLAPSLSLSLPHPLSVSPGVPCSFTPSLCRDRDNDRNDDPERLYPTTN